VEGLRAVLAQFQEIAEDLGVGVPADVGL